MKGELQQKIGTRETNRRIKDVVVVNILFIFNFVYLDTSSAVNSLEASAVIFHRRARK